MKNPESIQAEQAIEEKTAPQHDRGDPNSEIRVLIVEDSPTQTLIIGQMLRPTANVTFHFQCVDCVAAAMQRLEECPFDALLLDLMLPDSIGMDSFLRLYACHPDVPIVVLTGLDENQLVTELLQKGAQDYLVKSKLDQEMLSRSIRYAIERNRRQQAEKIVLRTQLEERRRLARELHDGVIQSLSAIRLGLQVVEDDLNRSGDRKKAAAIRELCEEARNAIHDVRLLSYDLHPSELDKRQLEDAISSFGKQLAKQSKLSVELSSECTQLLNDHVKNHLYRIVQESMRNAARHASATRLEIKMRIKDFLMIVEVQDDGIGFDEQEASSSSGLGLISIHERARMLGGSARIQSQPGAGTCVLIEIPI